MSQRPEILFPLFSDLTKLKGVGPKAKDAFEQLAVYKPKDLLFTLPYRGVDRTLVDTIEGIPLPKIVTLKIKVTKHFPSSSRNRPMRVMVSDQKTSFPIVFFHAKSDWIAKLLPVGEDRIVSGKVEIFDGIAQMVHPDFVEIPNNESQIPSFEPIYPLTTGITQKIMTKSVAQVIETLPVLDEWIPETVLADQNWPDWKSAILASHNPKNDGEISALAKHRERLAFDEFYAHALTLALARSNRRKRKGKQSRGDGKLRKQLIETLPFELTNAQERVIEEITSDVQSEERMNRLLQGDVGSGKTLVALMAMLIVVEAGGQAAMMAPTEILARQHLDGLSSFLKGLDIRAEVLTGRDKGKDRSKKLEDLKNGKINILLGTHAIFQSDVVFQDLRLSIIDEQHRFGVRERLQLSEKGSATDVLVMTATPIPRSLALTHYGDMDVSILDEKPEGRMPIDTVLVSQSRTQDVIERLRNAISEGRQCYWVCPLVEESEVLNLTAAEERFRSLKVAFGDENVGLVHGQMSPIEKDAAMAKFVAGETKLLVATTVIEVGVNVPAASIMVIEGAEHFGLAQLHQLRGRVGRGNIKSTCVLLYRNLGKTSKLRLETMRRTEDGFEISEQDLKIRGAGDVLGVAQSGLPRFRIADAESQTHLMKLAHDTARFVLNTDPNLISGTGNAIRVLLYLHEQEQGIRLISVG